MRLLLFVSALLLAPCSLASTKVDLKQVSVSEAVQLLYAETMKGSYVVGPELASDQRQITFRHSGEPRIFVRNMLSTLGYQIDTRDGVDFITKTDSQLKPQQAQTMVYRPLYREPDYFVRMLSPLFSGSFLTRRQVTAPEGTQASHDAPAGSAASLVQQKTDVVVFAGSKDEIKRLDDLLKQLDQPAPQLVVEAFMYEFSDSSSSASALKIAGSLLDKKLGISIGATLLQPSANLTFSSDSLSAAIGLLNEDSRFHLISSPRLRVADGELATFQSGAETPVLGSVSFNNSGLPVQSVEYRDSGVILKIKPRILKETIRLSVDHQISSFSRTESGVNGSPTLSKKSLSSDIELKDGDVAILGGLTDEKSSASTSRPFLISLFSGKSEQKSKSETILLLRVSKI